MLSSSIRSFVAGLIAFSAIGHVANAQAPLPSCTSLGVASQFDCQTQCTNKGTTQQAFREANGVSECTCATAKICDDAPSCAELLIEPGKAEAQCRSICPSGTVVTVDDYAEFAGNANNANIDQTHMVISCSCSGQKQCGDSILFSDKVNLPECMDKGITSQETCNALCGSYGTIFLGHDYDSRYNGEESVCTCTGPNGEPKAPYCADLDRRAAAGMSAAGMPAVTTAVVMSYMLVLSLMI